MADTIGMNFRGAIKQIRMNGRYDCLDHNPAGKFCQGLQKPCPGGGAFCDPHTVTSGTITQKDVQYSSCGLGTYDLGCSVCHSDCEYCTGGAFTQCTKCDENPAQHLIRHPERFTGG